MRQPSESTSKARQRRINFIGITARRWLGVVMAIALCLSLVAVPAPPAQAAPIDLTQCTPVMQLDSTGACVVYLQEALNARGASPILATDGQFGPLTEAAVRSYQASMGLVADGIVGPATHAALTASVSTPAPATAANGRAASPDGELTAYFIHGLGREPDPGGFENYMSFIRQDCRWGLLDAGIKLLDSEEAHNRWGTTESKVGALYAALLNRAPDPGGFNTYVHAVNTRGMRWAITSIQSSPEFHNRFAPICNGWSQTNATLWDPQQGVLQAIAIHDAAEPLLWACGVSILTPGIGKIKLLRDASRLIKWSASAALAAAQARGGGCWSAYNSVKAADEALSIVQWEGANNPLFLQRTTREYWRYSGRWCETWIRVGPDAMTWTGYKANYRC